jgi:hypothetical protein
VATALTEVRTRSTELVADRNAPRNARLFTGRTLAEWDLEHLSEDACAGVSELSAWMTAPDAASEEAAIQRVTLVWDDPLLFTEVADVGGTPLRPGAPLAGELAARVLEAVALEWGTQAAPGGWQLWASYAAGRGEG